jgi:SAM-dependent methyltransferase
LGETFDTVIDSGLLHILSEADRARLVAGLHAVLRPGGYLHLLAFNEHATWPGPRRLTQTEILTTFEQGWEVEAISTLPLRSGRRVIGLQLSCPVTPPDRPRHIGA